MENNYWQNKTEAWLLLVKGRKKERGIKGFWALRDGDYSILKRLIGSRYVAFFFCMFNEVKNCVISNKNANFN